MHILESNGHSCQVCQKIFKPRESAILLRDKQGTRLAECRISVHSHRHHLSHAPLTCDFGSISIFLNIIQKIYVIYILYFTYYRCNIHYLCIYFSYFCIMCHIKIHITCQYLCSYYSPSLPNHSCHTLGIFSKS